jgi:hypothetical protein
MQMMKVTLVLGLVALSTACGDNGVALGSRTSGGSSGAGGAAAGSAGAASGGVAGNSQAGGAGAATAGSGGAGGGSSGAGGAGAGGDAGATGSGGAGEAGAPGTAGSAGAGSDECSACMPQGQICIYQVGGPGPARFLCATQLPCGAAGACACIVDQGTCTFVPDDGGTSGMCQCDNGLD